MADYIEPLNLQYIIQNYLAGSQGIAFGIIMMGLSILAAAFKLPMPIYFIILVLTAIMLLPIFGFGFYLLMIVIMSMIVFYTVSRLVKS